MDHMNAAAPSGSALNIGVDRERRDQIMREDYPAGVSVEEIGAKIGLGPQSVRNLASELGLSRERKTLPSNGKSISPMHATIGQKLSQYRCFGAAVLHPKVVSSQLGISIKKLTLIERGQVELSLSEIQKIAKLIGLDVDKLLTPGVFPK